MATLADGRIVLWEGGSLWAMRVPALPSAKSRTDFHTHHALQITLSLDGNFQLHLPDRSFGGSAVIVAADASHAFEPKGTIALLFVDPESASGRSLAASLLGDASVAPLSEAHAGLLRQPILELLARASTEQEWREVGRRLIDALAGPQVAPPPDARVEHTIAWATHHLEDRLSIAEVAAEVGLSIDRMSHLFVEQTGLPFRTYVLWLRMRKALEAYTRGEPLTRAAHDAGFADSAHFSRTFRRMFGVAAAELRLT